MRERRPPIRTTVLYTYCLVLRSSDLGTVILRGLLLWFITDFAVMLGHLLTVGFTDLAVILGLGFGPLRGTTNTPLPE